MESNVLLSILIPTFNRPESVKRAINSCIEINDNRVNLFINSNGFQEDLEYLRNFNERVIYSNFDVNKGAILNFKYLLNKSNGKFSLFLSDEDYINSNQLLYFLDWLDLNKNISVGFCKIINEVDGINYFYINKNKLSFKYITFMNPYVHTYMSGYIINNSLLSNINLDNVFSNHSSNVYPHVVLSFHLLKLRNGAFFNGNLIIKGEEKRIGGDSHSHVNSIQNTNYLNPSIYGAYARAMQYYFLLDSFNKIQKPNIFNFYNLIFDIYLTIDFVKAIELSESVTGLKDDIFLVTKTAQKDSIYNGIEIKGFISKNFYNFLNNSLFRIVLKAIDLFRRFTNKFFNLCLK